MRVLRSGLAALLFALCGILALTTATLVLLPPGAAVAQSTVDASDYEAWASVANRAEEAIAGGRASDDAYEALRVELVTWREQLLAAQSANSARIATVRNQIAALGPAPAEGESESEDVAARRGELNQQLDALRAPILRAEEAFQRAEGLVGEIDQLIAARQADALLERQVMPVNPANWGPAIARLQRSMQTMTNEIVANWKSPVAAANRNESLPFIAGLLIFALAMILRGASWSRRLESQARKRLGPSVAGFLISLGQVLLPTVGVFALVYALKATSIPGLRATALLNGLPVLALAITVAIWIAGRVFPRFGSALVIRPMEPEVRARIRRLAVAGATVFGLHSIVASLAETVSYEPAITAVLYFPTIVLEGIVLFALGRTLIVEIRRHEDNPNLGVFQANAMRFVARVSMLVGIIAPVAAGLGYTNAALQTVYPMCQSLVLLGGLVIVQRLSVQIHRLLTRSTLEESHEALMPILITSLVVLAAVPFFAMIWGTRVATLLELWTQFRAGFDLGGTRISPSDFLTFLLVFGIGYGVTRLAQSALRTSILPKTGIEPGGRNAITSGVGYVGIFLAALIAITSTGIDLSSLAIVAGALSVGIGFGLQNIVSNFVSGIILLVERPIGEGDWIEVGGNMGIVKAISVRSTRIETFDRTQVIVPNADFVSGTVTNWTRGNRNGRVMIKIGVAYGTDTRRVEDILREVAMSHDMVISDPPPSVAFAEFGADSLNFEIRAILYDVNFLLSVRSELNHRIAERLRDEGIEIPFAQRDIWLRNPEALVDRPAASAPPAATPPLAAPEPARDLLTQDDLTIEDDTGDDGDIR